MQDNYLQDTKSYRNDSALKTILNLELAVVAINKSENNVIIQDASSGSADNVSKYGAILGHKYPVIGAESTDTLIDNEYLVS